MNKRKVFTVVYIVFLLLCFVLFLCPAASLLLYTCENYDTEAFVGVLLLVLFTMFSGMIFATLDCFIDPLIERKLLKKRFANGCPMLECQDKKCVYFDKECLSCKFAAVPAAPEVPGNE